MERPARGCIAPGIWCDGARRGCSTSWGALTSRSRSGAFGSSRVRSRLCWSRHPGVAQAECHRARGSSGRQAPGGLPSCPLVARALILLPCAHTSGKGCPTTRYRRPSVLLDALPLTPNGKLDRRGLPARKFGATKGGWRARRTAQEENPCALSCRDSWPPTGRDRGQLLCAWGRQHQLDTTG